MNTITIIKLHLTYMKRLTLLLLFLLSLGLSHQMKALSNSYSFLSYSKDSLLNKLTDMNQQVKIFIDKDTLRGYSTPQKVEISNYFASPTNEDVQRDRNGLISLPFEYEPFLSYVGFSDTVIIVPAMLPVVFDGQILPPDLSFTSQSDLLKNNTLEQTLISRDSIVGSSLYEYNKKYQNNYKLIREDRTLSLDLWENKRTQDLRREYYTEHPNLIKSNALEYTALPTLQQELEQKNPFQKLISTGEAIQIARPELTRTEIKQKFWKTGANHELKISQKSYSGNWTPNTNDNFQLQNYHKFSADYKRDKIEFTHWIEWRFNAQYTQLPSLEQKDPDNPEPDNRTRFLINDDWIKTYNKLGLQSFIKKWSYILNLDIKTPLFNKRPQNNKHQKLAGLFSPLEINFGVGAGYTLEKKSTKVKNRNFKLTVDATPFSLNFKYIDSDLVWSKNKYGVVYDPKNNKRDRDRGKKAEDRRYSKTDFGSTLNARVTYSFNSYADVTSRFHYFTNYHKGYVEWENTINFQLNRYLATSLYVYMKFDDSVSPDKKHKHLGYFSFNEVLGFGLSYKW